MSFVEECPHCGVKSLFRCYLGNMSEGIFSCVNCDRSVYRRMIKEKVDLYPKKTVKSHESIPQDVAKDYEEAIRCNDASAPRATVAMCRRALQNSVIERGAKKDDLYIQIDELEKKRIITPQLAQWAHTIRTFGNIGAHPDEDGLKDVTDKDAEEILKFMEKYLEYVYIMPFSLDMARKELEKGTKRVQI